MRVQEIMTADPVCCTPDTSIQNVARLMLDNDCGEIPIVDDLETRRLVGVATDRDIACRAVAMGRNPLSTTATDVMSGSVVTVSPESDLQECCDKMERHQVRRIPVVDAQGRCCGIVSQADIARQADEHETGEVVRYVSRPNRTGTGASARL